LVRIPSDPENSGRSGDLTFLDNSVQNGSGTVGLRATIPNPDRHFWPGQFVNVRLILATAKGAVLIPNQAAQISQRGPFVYVVKQDNTADLRQVTLGQKQGDDVVVTKGLAAGDLVVVTGQLSVHPGAPVSVQANPPSSAQPGANSTSGPASGSGQQKTTGGGQ
jgi:multidrug efflux system membrane fusion protein